MADYMSLLLRMYQQTPEAKILTSSVRFQDIRRGRYAEKAQVVLVMGNIRFEWSVVCCFWSYLSSTNIEEVKRLIGHLWT